MKLTDTVQCPRCDGGGLGGWGKREIWCRNCGGTGTVRVEVSQSIDVAQVLEGK